MESLTIFLILKLTATFSQQAHSYFIKKNQGQYFKEFVANIYKRLPTGKKGLLKAVQALESTALKNNNFISISEYFHNYQKLLEEENWKKCINTDSVIFLKHCFELFLRINRWLEFKSAALIMWKIRNATFTDGGDIVAPFKNIFHELSTKDILEKLIQYQFHGSDEQKVFAGKVMAYFGDDGVMYTLHRLVFSPKKNDRFQLLKILKSYGNDTLPSIRKFLDEDLPWYAVRNLIIAVAKYWQSWKL